MDPLKTLHPIVLLLPIYLFFKVLGLNQDFNLINRKSRLPRLRDVQGRSCSSLPQALGNKEDGV
jgi:hypothetical protein